MQPVRSSSISSPPPPPPTAIPEHVYRVHRPSAQTRYSFSTGFRSKNQTTIVNYTSTLRTFGLAHLNGVTNISSPLISVYDSSTQAERLAHYFGQKYGEETWVVKIDTRHLARGPVFRAADLLEGQDGDMAEGERELHRGEYLIMYKIPPQAIRDETLVGRGAVAKWRAVGTIDSGV